MIERLQLKQLQNDIGEKPFGEVTAGSNVEFLDRLANWEDLPHSAFCLISPTRPTSFSIS